jgi:ubiquinone/menaquinone biosynthesis C-methylase UbiE
LSLSRRYLQGDLFALPYRDGSLDGIFNLGVMEHFTGPQIDRILQEFHRVLKPNGRVILFWPPEFGLSVMALKTVAWMELHPPEISRIPSFAWARAVMARNRFRVLGMHFGWRDLFAQVVVVAEKTG